MTVKVLLVTTVRWPSAGRLAGAFAATGCAVDALLPSGHPAARSRYFEHVYGYRPLSGVSSFVDAAERSHSDVVLALDDRATALLVRARERAPDHIATLIVQSLGC